MQQLEHHDPPAVRRLATGLRTWAVVIAIALASYCAQVVLPQAWACVAGTRCP
jgi:hypothetical protein